MFLPLILNIMFVSNCSLDFVMFASKLKCNKRHAQEKWLRPQYGYFKKRINILSEQRGNEFSFLYCKCFMIFLYQRIAYDSMLPLYVCN